MADIIIKNAYVLTMDPEVGDLKNGTVVIEDGKITEIGEKTERKCRNRNRCKTFGSNARACKYAHSRRNDAF